MVSINPTLNTIPTIAYLTAALRLGQPFDAKVINVSPQIDKIAITLQLNKQLTVLVQTSPGLTITPGQTLSIVVDQLSPELQFKLLLAPPINTATSTKPEIRLTAIGYYKPSNTLPAVNNNTPAVPLTLKQQLTATVTQINGPQIQLQLALANPTTGTNKTPVNIELKQIINFAELQIRNLPIGASLKLEVTKTGLQPEFKILPAISQTTAENIPELIKQLLPQHEAPPVLLNQLKAALPELIASKRIPETLKQLAQQILQELPQSPAHIDSQSLKTAISNAGLFLESKLALNIKQPNIDIKADFKGNLLKLKHALEGEIEQQKSISPEFPELNTLKDLQQKTEQTLAKLVLDQLISLPKEETGKQIWQLDIPFLDRGQVQTAQLKIEYEPNPKTAETEPENRHDWSVKLTLEPPGLGTINCTIVSKNNVINSYFLSQKESTADLISQYLGHLKSQFENSGLATGQLIAHNQVVTPPSHTQHANPTLFSDKA
ncbi:MAG: flagellar hook-length control protein FliK [Methylococcaceae bacterium]|jgi:hypothetical protein